MYTKKVYVKHVSIVTLQESGFELGDDGVHEEQIYGRFGELALISCLTNRQRQVVNLLSQGYSRKEVAIKLDISLQAVHQIVPRIRERVKEHVGRS